MLCRIAYRKNIQSLRLGSHMRQIFEIPEDDADNFVSELVRGNFNMSFCGRAVEAIVSDINVT